MYSLWRDELEKINNKVYIIAFLFDQIHLGQMTTRVFCLRIRRSHRQERKALLSIIWIEKNQNIRIGLNFRKTGIWKRIPVGVARWLLIYSISHFRMSENCWSFRDWPKTKNGNSWNIDMVGYNSDLGKNSIISTPNGPRWTVHHEGSKMTIYDLE